MSKQENLRVRTGFTRSPKWSIVRDAAEDCQTSVNTGNGRDFREDLYRRGPEGRSQGGLRGGYYRHKLRDVVLGPPQPAAQPEWSVVCLMVSMNISDEIIRLQELHASGVLTDDEFARAKDAVIAQGDDASGPLEQIRFESELARVDREWELEREAYMVTGRYGARHVPSEGGGLVAIFVGGGFILIWTVMAYSAGAPVILPLFGIAGIIGVVCMGIAAMDKAGQYREAEQRYQRRRAELTEKEKRQAR